MNYVPCYVNTHLDALESLTATVALLAKVDKRIFVATRNLY